MVTRKERRMQVSVWEKKYITFEYVENEMTIITAIEEADYIYM